MPPDKILLVLGHLVNTNLGPGAAVVEVGV